jgi:glycerophosphoryl diester phosphodiesterase
MASNDPKSPRIPILFGHRGARAYVRENTLESFATAIKLGATGLETDCWMTGDGIVVLDHDGVARRFPRRSIGRTKRDRLETHIPALQDLLRMAGDVELSIDVKDPACMPNLVRDLEICNFNQNRVWICHPDFDLLTDWAHTYPDCRYVHSTRLKVIRPILESHISQMASAGIEVLNMHHTDWTHGLVVLAHKFGVKAFAWDAQFPDAIAGLIQMDVDAIYSDWVDRMVDAAEATQQRH